MPEEKTQEAEAAQQNMTADSDATPQDKRRSLDMRLTALQEEMRMLRETIMPMLGEIRQRLLMRIEE